MPTWGEILLEIQTEVAAQGVVDIDALRLRYLTAMQQHTGRSLIVYTGDIFANNPNNQINLQDMAGFMEVFKDLPGPDLDLVVYSPGGQAEATDRIVRYLRSKFTNIRVFVPFAAMSAATMMAMSADEIVMGKHSQLGPIDPQITFRGVTMPAGALVDQFREAQQECTSDPAKITGWLPTLQQYPPGLLNLCESATALAKQLVAEWLQTYMFAQYKTAQRKAERAADWLADDKVHLSHGRAITREDLRAHGIKVTNLEKDQKLQDAVLSVHHVTMHTINAGTAVKVIENHLGRRWVQHSQAVAMQGPQQALPGSVLAALPQGIIAG